MWSPGAGIRGPLPKGRATGFARRVAGFAISEAADRSQPVRRAGEGRQVTAVSEEEEEQRQRECR